MREIESEFNIGPDQAVADAMMVAVYKQVEYSLKNMKNGGDFDSVIKEIMKKDTCGGCRLGSAYVLMYLRDKYPSQFNKMLMIETHVCGPWAWHNYFLVKGIDGVWYAGSPANSGEGTTDRTTNVISNMSLHKVIGEVECIEGCTWPSPESILKFADNNDMRIEFHQMKPERLMDYFCVTYDKKQETGRWMMIKV